MEKLRISCGEWGSCFWEIDSDGMLSIGEGTGYSLLQTGDAPWYRYRDSIKSIRFSGKASVTYGGRLSYMFCGCSSAVFADFAGLDTANAEAMNSMFHSCSSLEKINFGDTFDTGRVRNMSRMFFGCSSLDEIDLSSFDTAAVMDMGSMFEGCEKLQSLDLSSFSTGSLISMSRMFGNCRALKELDLSTFDTSKVTGMSGLFSGCTGLEQIDISALDTSSAINMISMFSSCESLRELDLSSFRTHRVTDMSWMFCGCRNLKKLDISSFDTSGVTDMSCMFFTCRSLEELDLSGFDVSRTVNMDNMFMYCSSLRCLDLSGFDTTGAENMKDMFTGCDSLSSVHTGPLFDFHIESENGCFLPEAQISSGSGAPSWIRASDTAAVTADSVRSCEDEIYYIRGRKFRVSYEASGGTGSMADCGGFFDAESTPEAGDSGFKPLPGYVFKEWNTGRGRNGRSYRPGEKLAPLCTDVVLHAVWASSPTISRPEKPPQISYGSRLDLRFPYIGENNGEITEKGVEISRDGQEWSRYDTDSIPEVSDSGSWIRYYASNFAGTAYTDPVQISVARGRYDMSHVRWNCRSFEYDGTQKSVRLEGLPEGVTAEYSGSEAVSAGRYTASVVLRTDDENYEPPGTVADFTWEIRRASYDMRSIRWNCSGPFVYDGSEKTVEIENLPEGVTAFYRGSRQTDAGRYVAKAVFRIEDTENYRVPDIQTFQWEIIKADYDMSSVRWDYDAPLPYSGELRRVTLAGLPEGVTATYYGNTGIAAGRYEASAALHAGDRKNYNTPVTDSLEWEISKAVYDMGSVHWKYVEEPVYDGYVKTVVLDGLPEGVTAEYDGSSAVDAGSYHASAVLSWDRENYEPPEIEDFSWEIKKASYDLSTVRWNYSEPFTYDGIAKNVSLAGLPESIKAVYSGSWASDAGSYRAEVDLEPRDPDNYEKPEMEGIDWSISKCRCDMSHAMWDFDDDIVYDGTEKTIRITGLPEGVTASYSGSSAVSAGNYTAHADLAIADTDNYEVPVIEDCSWRIHKARYDMSSVSWQYSSDDVYDGTVKSVELIGLPEGVTAQYSENKAIYAAEYIASAVFEYDRENYEEPIFENCFWKIKKAVFDTEGAFWDTGADLVYDGTEKTVSITGLPEGVSVHYKGNTATDAGHYFAEAELIPDDETNFERPHIEGCSWEIKKADHDISGAAWCSCDGFVYDGEPKSMYLDGLPEGVFAEYEGGYETEAGIYTAEAVFSVADARNWNVPANISHTWHIGKAEHDMRGVVWSYHGDTVYDGEPKKVVLENLPEGVEAEYSGNTGVLSGSYEAIAMLRASDRQNYNDPAAMTLSWEISRAAHDMSHAEWIYSEEPVYDGTEKSVMLEGLPDGISVRYEGSTAVSAGIYTAEAFFASLDEDNYDTPEPARYTWEIHKGSYDMSEVRIGYDVEPVYDGGPKKVYLEGLPDGVTAALSGDSATEAGTHTCRAEFTTDDSDNYNAPAPMTFTWEIARAVYDMSNVIWEYSGDPVYDGTEKSVILTGLPEGVEAVYSENRKTDAGEYTAYAEFTADSRNHIIPAPMTFEWSIAKKIPDISSVYWEYDGNYVYDGTYKSVELRNLPEDMRVTYRGNIGSRAGKYTASAVLRPADPANHAAPPIENCEWEIKKAEYDMSSVRWTYDEPFLYDGQTKEITLEGLPEGVRARYIGNSWEDAGEYIADADFEYDRENYEHPVVLPCIWQINKTDYDMSGVTWEYADDFVYDGTEKCVYVTGMPAGVSALYEGNYGTCAGEYHAVAVFEYDEVNYNRPENSELAWEIHKARYDMKHVRWDYSVPFIYDGTEKIIELERPKKHTGGIMKLIRSLIQDEPEETGLPEGVSVRYEGNRAVGAGVYTAEAFFDVEDPQNYEIPEPMPPYEWEIAKGRYDMSRAGWVYDNEPVYDGTEKSVSVAGLPEGVCAICSDNVFTDAGKYTASAVIIINDVDNYEVPSVDDFQWQIAKGEYDMSGAVWDYSGPFTYDGSEKNISLTGLPEGVTAELSGNRATDAGVYTAEADLVISDPDNYNVPSVRGCKWKIVRADYDMSRVHWDYDGPYIYDGNEKTVILQELPEGVTAEYTGNKASEAGIHNAKARFLYDRTNYREPVSAGTCRWEISKKETELTVEENTIVKKENEGSFDIIFHTDAAETDFRISDRSIASVSPSGHVQINGPGSTVITLSSWDKNHKKSYREIILIIEKI